MTAPRRPPPPTSAQDYMPPKPYSDASLDEAHRLLKRAADAVVEAQVENRRRKQRKVAGAIRKSRREAMNARSVLAALLKSRKDGEGA